MSDTTDTTPSWWQRLRARRSTRWAIDIAIVLVLIALISAFQGRHLLSSGDPLPPMELESLDGEVLSLSDLDAHRTIIYFWATWCGACDLQSGAISKLHQADHDDLDVVSIVLHYSSREAVERHVAENQIDYPVYLGTPAHAAEFNIESFPTVYIVDDEATIRHGLVGYTTRWGLWVRARFL